MSGKKTLIFIDIDGTLLRPDYKPNSSAVPALIKKLSKKDYIFSLNSNRATHDLVSVAKKFGITGPLIGENGVFVREKGKERKLVNVRRIEKILEPILQKLAQENGAKILRMDTVRNGKEKKSHTGATWLVNRFREYTASIHVRNNGMRDVRAARSLAQKLRKALPNSYAVTVSSIFANVLVSPRSMDKGKAAAKLRKTSFPSSRIVMIGDDDADAPMIRVADAFYAVGNASKALKKRATFSAKRPYTQGVAEILRAIDSDS